MNQFMSLWFSPIADYCIHQVILFEDVLNEIKFAPHIIVGRYPQQVKKFMNLREFVMSRLYSRCVERMLVIAKH